jgi:hypothetical protein
MPAVRVIGALQGREVFCREKTGIFEGSIIRCKCCNKDFAPSAFEHHSGSSFRRPWKSIKDINGKSIQEYRDEQENSQVDALEAHKEDNSVVERILSSRVRQVKLVLHRLCLAPSQQVFKIFLGGEGILGKMGKLRHFLQ